MEMNHPNKRPPEDREPLLSEFVRYSTKGMFYVLEEAGFHTIWDRKQMTYKEGMDWVETWNEIAILAGEALNE